MKQTSAKKPGSATEPRASERAGVRTVFLALIFFLLGIAIGAFWFYRLNHRAAKVSDESKQLVVLSDSTRTVLNRLDSPVEIRFYSLLDPATVPGSLPAFAGRVDLLLAAFERDSNGKVKVTRHNSRSDSDARAAVADAIKAFNRDKGDTCYLGLAITQNDRKESFAALSPEWEQALEFDLSRAIVRLTTPKPAAQPPAGAAQTDTAAIEEVKRAIPNVVSVSVEDGTRILREKALVDFGAAAKEMEVKIKEAGQRVTEAKNNGSEADQQTAVKNLQQVQAEQTEKLKEITARLQAQIAALEQLKKAVP